MSGAGVGSVREHLVALARQPRPAGSAAERAAQDYVAAVLIHAGFHVRRHAFSYSAFPGRWGTPIGGALVVASVLASASAALAGAPCVAAAVLAVGLLLSGVFASAMLGDGVLVLPWLRAEAENLVATRGDESPAVWLVAHTDSKSQPVPSLLRVAGVVLLALGVALAIVGLVLQLAALPYRMAWLGAGLCAVVGGLPVLCSVVDARSDGAVDNASGVAAVLAATARVRPDVAFGVLVPSAEELGLAGARAWVRSMAIEGKAGIAINCDGVDDEGGTMIMYSGRAPRTVIGAMQRAAAAPVRARRIPLGVLTDSMAFSERGWAAVTVSRGSLATLRRVHTPCDSLANLCGDGIDDVAILLARAVEALA